MYGAGLRVNTGKFVSNTKKMTTVSIAEMLAVTLSLFAGLAIGTVFFGGLWWTTSRVAATKRPALLFVASFVVRTSFAISGLYAVGNARLERLSACLLGFFAVRFLILRLTRPATERGRFTQSRCSQGDLEIRASRRSEAPKRCCSHAALLTPRPRRSEARPR